MRRASSITDRDPFAIGIAGPSGSGKSWLADRLQAALGKECARLSLDRFYRDRSRLSPSRRARINFDHPRAVDWEEFEAAFEGLLRGREVSVPEYSFETHSRTGRVLVKPASVLIVEGLWTWRRPSVRRRLQWRIFVDCPPKVCLDRRLARDQAERGRGPESVRKQFAAWVWPMGERWVLPQRRWADAVLSGSTTSSEAAELVERIRIMRAGIFC